LIHIKDRSELLDDCAGHRTVGGPCRSAHRVLTCSPRLSHPVDDQALLFTPSEWEAFVLGAKDGEFDVM
jgi:hypothetical protein